MIMTVTVTMRMKRIMQITMEITLTTVIKNGIVHDNESDCVTGKMTMALLMTITTALTWATAMTVTPTEINVSASTINNVSGNDIDYENNNGNHIDDAHHNRMGNGNTTDNGSDSGDDNDIDHDNNNVNHCQF